MTYLCEKFKGLKIVLKPAMLGKDSIGQFKTTGGEYIKFFMGRYQTKDIETIKKLNYFIKTNRSLDIRIVDEDRELAISNAVADAKAKAVKEYDDKIKTAETKAEKEYAEIQKTAENSGDDSASTGRTDEEKNAELLAGDSALKNLKPTAKARKKMKDLNDIQ